MKNKNFIPQKERDARSKLTKLVNYYPFVKGGVVTSGRKCGKPQCKCTTGEKHLSTYLSIKHEGKRKMVCVPKQFEKDIHSWVKTYKDIMNSIDIISDYHINRLIKLKNTKQND
ncbi:hypothetical protein HY745_01940 [Candidatus Desantisbacteria bacterium]|nr:hypothetical protein [Candidatus Desantisbacteria bacterium]